MRRIYLESIIGIFICFFVGLTAYEFSVYRWTTDYEYLLEEYEASAHQEMLQNILDNQGPEQALSAISLFTKTTRNTLTTFSSDDSIPERVSKYFSLNTGMKVYFDEDRDLWIRLDGIDATFLYSPNEESLVRQKVEFENSLIWVFFGTSFVLYGVVHLLIIFRRVNKLEKATLKFAQGDLSTRAETSSSSAIGSLNRSFNIMADRIYHLIETNRALTNAVAHELRTPIFRIQWQAELLKETSMSVSQQATVESIVEDTEEMEQMVDELLCYSKLDTQHIELECQTISPILLIEGALGRWKKETSFEIILLNSEHIEGKIFVDKKLLTRALDNLVRNAIKFTKSKILIEVHEEREVVSIAIHDDGPGIETEHLSRLFDPFYVGSKARNKSKSGHGLGLSIVKKICEQHEAQVDVGRSQILHGALFTLSVPLCNKPADNHIQ
ncbi:sensor histidine kinase [Vibrio atypicus]|uniref:sensor histidine kinase n=1 Tax=Vibrio atypicus TaxID=558271 RepID=UPI00135A5EB7|nr:ATP-binding protein [Vibrio atypicus]